MKGNENHGAGELCLSDQIKEKTVKSLRDLHRYVTDDGVSIKNGILVRNISTGVQYTVVYKPEDNVFIGVPLSGDFVLISNFGEGFVYDELKTEVEVEERYVDGLTNENGLGMTLLTAEPLKPNTRYNLLVREALNEKRPMIEKVYENIKKENKKTK